VKEKDMKFGKHLVCLLLSIVMIAVNGCANRNSNSETTTIIWPKYLINMMGYTAEQQVELFQEGNEDNKYADSVYANEEGTITFEMNGEQLQNCKEKFKNNVKKNIETARKYEIEVDISDDYKEVIFKYSKTVLMDDFLSIYALVVSSVVALRMFQGESPEDWHLKIKIINKDTDKIIKEGVAPDEEIRISPEDWKE